LRLGLVLALAPAWGGDGGVGVCPLVLVIGIGGGGGCGRWRRRGGVLEAAVSAHWSSSLAWGGGVLGGSGERRSLDAGWGGRLGLDGRKGTPKTFAERLDMGG
jgi:hypothetical protein